MEAFFLLLSGWHRGNAKVELPALPPALPPTELLGSCSSRSGQLTPAAIQIE
jgi:hypothetical protein